MIARAGASPRRILDWVLARFPGRGRQAGKPALARLPAFKPAEISGALTLGGLIVLLLLLRWLGA